SQAPVFLVAPYSFPTRRSSDLRFLRSALPSPWSLSGYSILPAAVREVKRLNCWKIMPIFLRIPRSFDSGIFEISVPSSSTLPERSEEHTSELQSRFDLVCRLLL